VPAKVKVLDICFSVLLLYHYYSKTGIIGQVWANVTFLQRLFLC